MNIIYHDDGQPESSGRGGIVFALSDGSNPVTFVIKEMKNQDIPFVFDVKTGKTCSVRRLAR